MQNSFCADEYCTARIKADDADVYVEYKLDDASVAEMEVINVIRFNESVNAEIDRYEIQKINAAIVGGVKWASKHLRADVVALQVNHTNFTASQMS